MALIYLAEGFVMIEPALKLLVNWLILLTFPLWVGLVFLFSFVYKATLSRKHVERDVVTGRLWIWDAFRMY